MDEFWTVSAGYALAVVCVVVCYGVTMWSSIGECAARRLAWGSAAAAACALMGVKAVLLAPQYSLGFDPWDDSLLEVVDVWGIVVLAAVFAACAYVQHVLCDDAAIASRGEMALAAAAAAIPLGVSVEKMEVDFAVMLVVACVVAAVAVAQVSARGLAECGEDEAEFGADACAVEDDEHGRRMVTPLIVRLEGKRGDDADGTAAAGDAAAADSSASAGPNAGGVSVGADAGDSTGAGRPSDPCSDSASGADGPRFMSLGASHRVALGALGVVAVIALAAVIVFAGSTMQQDRAPVVDLTLTGVQERYGAQTVECTVPYVVLDRDVRTSEVGSAASYWVAVDADTAGAPSLDSALRSRLMEEDGIEPGSNVTLNLCDAACLAELERGDVESTEALRIMQHYRLSTSF